MPLLTSGNVRSLPGSSLVRYFGMVSRSKGRSVLGMVTAVCHPGSRYGGHPAVLHGQREASLCPCMVQVRDQLDPEYFVAAHQCTDGSWTVCSYADGLQAFDGTLQHRIGERRPVICGPVAGQSDWVAELEGDPTAVQLTAAGCHFNFTPPSVAAMLTLQPALVQDCRAAQP